MAAPDFKNGFVEATIEADGFSIRHLEAGDGPPLIWFHGGGGIRLSPVYDNLAAHYQIIAFEIPGFGNSAVNDQSEDMQALARTMLEAVTVLGIESFDLAGTSFGGTLACWVATEAPERIATLVLCSPAAIRQELAPGETPKPVTPVMLYHHPECQPQALPRPAEIGEKEVALMKRLRGPNRDAELESQLAKLETQTLVLFGTEDQVTPCELGEIYRAVTPACQQVLIYDAAHAIDADRPEAVTAVIQDFLSRHESFLVKDQSGLLYP
jgi:pimeloyl-ACP methyl ester carboxylesterase